MSKEFKEVPVDSHEDYTKFYSSLYKGGYGKTPSYAELLLKKWLGSKEFASLGFKDILEIGCGRANLVKALKLHKHTYVATEVCPWILKRELKNFRVFPYDAYDLVNFEDASFDCVIALDFLEAVRTKKEALLAVQEAARLTRKCFIVSFGGELLWQTKNLKTVEKKMSWWRGVIQHHFKGEITTTPLRWGCLLKIWHDSTA